MAKFFLRADRIFVTSVLQYKLLFVHFRPYESRGQAWPISFDRVCTGLVM